MSKDITRPPSVLIAFRTLGRSLRHGYENLIPLGVASIFWLLCTAPFFPIFALAGILLGYGSVLVLFIGVLIVGIGPPSAALHRIVKPMTEERASSSNTFWSHLRPDAGWSLRLSLTMLLILLLWLANTSFYSGNVNMTLQLISGFFTIASVVWLGIMLYAMPMALRQSDRSLRTTLRNTVVIALATLPGLFVSLILLVITTGILIILPPLFLVVPGWIALWTEENVRLILVASGHIEPDEVADRSS